MYGEGVDQARHVVLDIGAACFDAFKSFKTEGFTLSVGDDTQGVGQARRYDQQTPQHLLWGRRTVDGEWLIGAFTREA